MQIGNRPGMSCEECDAPADCSAKGWRTYLAYDPREDEIPYAVTYCPACSAREFGDGTHLDVRALEDAAE